MTPTVPLTECPKPEPVCYRLDRQYLWTGILCLPVPLGMIGAAVYLLVWGDDKSVDLALVIALGAEGMIFGLIAVWLIAASLCECLTVSDDAIAQRSCFKSRTIQANAVTAIDWKVWPARGRIVLWAGDKKIAVELANFTRDDRRQLVERIRQQFDSELQSGWTQFQERFFPATPRPTESVRTAVLCAVLFFVASLGLGYGWWLGLDVEFLFCCLGLVAVSGTYVWRIRRWLKTHKTARTSV